LGREEGNVFLGFGVVLAGDQVREMGNGEGGIETYEDII
jgi:hypothetical protein